MAGKNRAKNSIFIDKTGEILATASAINAVNDALTSHLADTMSQVIAVMRDLSVTGAQTVTTAANKKIRAIISFGAVNGSKKMSNLVWSPNQQSCIYVDGTNGNAYKTDQEGIVSQDSLANRTSYKIQNVGIGSFEILWSKLTGDGASGTIDMRILVFYHGGDN